jgi:hypothetical protein
MGDGATVQTTEKLSFINDEGNLIAPLDSPERYHYWKEGKLLLAKILAELNASSKTIERYTKRGSK